MYGVGWRVCMTEEEIGVFSTLKQYGIVENASLKRWGV